MYTALVMSSKGGVGKTVLALALAQGVASKGRKVVIIEADLLGPGIRAMVGLRQPKSAQYSLNELLLGGSDSVANWGKALSQLSGGFHDDIAVITSWSARDESLPAGAIGPELTISENNAKLNLISAVWYDPRAMRRSLAELIGALRQGGFDLAIIDCPPGLGFMTHIGLYATQEDDREGRDKSLLLWVLVPEPASFAASYTDAYIVQAQFRDALARSHFIFNKVPPGASDTGSGLLHRPRLFSLLAEYFARDPVKYSLTADDLSGLFRDECLHYASFTSGASHAVVDLGAATPDGPAGHDPQITADGIASVAPQSLINLLYGALFGEEPSMGGQR
jgi:MinD-like ATPase involved in chromosome partitioning or flagellar assembly